MLTSKIVSHRRRPVPMAKLGPGLRRDDEEGRHRTESSERIEALGDFRQHSCRRPRSATLRRLFRAPVYLYRWRCGWLLGRRFLLMINVGRRTGLRRHTVLEVMQYYRKEGQEAVVISAFGPDADCLRNTEATPDPEVVTCHPLGRLLGWRNDGQRVLAALDILYRIAV